MQIRPQFGNQQAAQAQREINRQMIEDTLHPLLPRALALATVAANHSNDAYATAANTVISNYLEATNPARLNRLG